MSRQRPHQRYLTRLLTLARMRRGDVLERFENYAAFRSDGAKVSLQTVSFMVYDREIVNAKPNIGAPYNLYQPQREPT